MATLQKCMDSRIGPLYLAASERGLQAVWWHDLGLQEALEPTSPQLPILQAAETQLTEYLEGKRQHFDLPLDAEGTPFQQKVWGELQHIPYGTTRSYKEIAVALADEKACRAVGTANGRNPLSIVVPCHRVIASNGTLAGYSGGLALKQKLLALEQQGTLP